jgi:hypothetical protein
MNLLNITHKSQRDRARDRARSDERSLWRHGRRSSRLGQRNSKRCKTERHGSREEHGARCGEEELEFTSSSKGDSIYTLKLL